MHMAQRGHQQLTARKRPSWAPWSALCLVIGCAPGCYRRHEANFQPSAAAASSEAPHRAADALQPSAAARKPADAQPLQPSAPTSPGADGALAARVATDVGLKVALFGDQGVGSNARAVLQLVKQEKADLVIHLGDLSYDEVTPAQWEAQIDAVLGPQFPYFVVIGNHDVASWSKPGGFAQRLTARLARIRGAQCRGEYGIDASCTYRGLHFVLSGVGTYGSDHEQFLREALDASRALHNLCVWHKNQHDMQVGAKTDEVGWNAYQICAAHAAPIITGHEHSYARTYALTALGDRARGHGASGRADELLLGPGRSFVAVSGLGGLSTRIWTSDHQRDSWWAAIYANDYQMRSGQKVGTDPSIEFGALFATFAVDGEAARADAYFKTVGGKIADRFRWRSAPGSGSSAR